MKKIIGIDIGGTKVAFGLLDDQNNLVDQLELRSNPSDSQLMYDVVVTGIKKILADNQLQEEAVAFGIGVPGIVDVEQGVAVFQNNLPWAEFPLVAELKNDFPAVTHISLDNDVSCAAKAEWQALGLGETDSMVFLTISTGIASPVIIGGKAVKGEGVAGEIGLMLVWHSLTKSLERLEEIASGPAIAKFGQQLYQNPKMTTKEVFECYDRHGEQAREIIDSAVFALAQAIYGIACLIDPTKIVLGGSVIMKNPSMLERLKTELGKMAIPVHAHIVDALVLSGYDNNAGLVGAAINAIN